jgi:Zn-dependent protease
MGQDAAQAPPENIDPDGLPEQTLDEMADAVRPPDVEVEPWRDETIEAITQLCIPQKELPPSLGFFLASAAISYSVLGLFFHDWILAAEVMVILYVHESGHYLAMKAFGYRDIQMFYIPFFGAAVSGRKNNATQVERALIALAGPAPGVLVASIFLYQYWNHKLSPDIPPNVTYIAFWTLVLNAPQLLPFEPLDGGHFFNAVFFSRHPRMETACKLIAAIVFLLAGIQWSWALVVLGAMAFFTLGVRHRMSILSRRLREMKLNSAAALDEMPLEQMVKAYALSRDLVPDSQAESMPKRVALRVGLLQRSYPAALARPATLETVLPLLMVYVLVVGCGVAAWRAKPTQQQQQQAPAQDDSELEEPRLPRIKMLEN